MTTILTGCSAEYEPLAAITVPPMKRFANRYGYRLSIVRDFPPGLGAPPWQKLRHISEALPDTEWLFWLGADCLITNPRIPLPVSLGPFEIAGSLDWFSGATYMSTDAMLIKNTPTMQALFADAAKTTPFVSAGGYDLVAIATTILGNPEYAKRRVILPRRRFQSIPRECGFPRRDIFDGKMAEPWQEGDFVMHATGVPLAERIKILTKYAKG